MKPIDTDSLILKLWGERSTYEDWETGKDLLVSLEEIKQTIDHMPTIDIVRCKECKHWEGTEQGGFYYFEHCSLTGLDMIYDDYCSRGERR